MNRSERRKNLRVAVKLETRLEDRKATPIEGVCENLSASGLFFVCDPKPAIGSICNLVVKMGDDRYHPAIRLQGKVIRQDEKGVGIQFMAIDLHDFELLKNIIVYSAEDPDAAEAEFRKYIDLYRVDKD